MKTIKKNILLSFFAIGLVCNHLQANLFILSTKGLWPIMKEQYGHISPMNGLLALTNIEYKYRCELGVSYNKKGEKIYKGSLGNLISGKFFYLHPGNFFGPSTLYNYASHFLTAFYIGKIVGLLENCEVLQEQKFTKKMNMALNEALLKNNFIETFKKKGGMALIKLKEKMKKNPTDQKLPKIINSLETILSDEKKISLFGSETLAKKITSLTTTFLFSTKKNDDKYCNKQDLINTFLALLMYKIENRADLIAYFQGLTSVLGDNIFAVDESFLTNKLIYTKYDYEHLKNEYLKNDLQKISSQELAELLFLHFGHFIFESPFPPYHKMMDIPLPEQDSYPDCGEDTIRLWIENHILNPKKRIFDYTILSIINEVAKKNNLNINIKQTVINFFKENSSLKDSAQRHAEWGNNICSGIKNVIYDTQNKYGIVGGLFNMVNVLADLFGIDITNISQENKSYYVFETIKRAFALVNIKIEHTIPKIILSEPVTSMEKIRYPFKLNKAGISTEFVWVFQIKHFYLEPWPEEPLSYYEKVIAFLKTDKSTDENSIITKLLLLSLFAHKNNEQACKEIVNSILSNQKMINYFSLLLCSPNDLIKKNVIEFWLANKSPTRENIKWINKILPTFINFDILNPIINKLCQNRHKKFFHDGIQRTLENLQEAHDKAIVIKTLIDNDLYDSYKNLQQIILKIVDIKNKIAIYGSIINTKKETPTALEKWAKEVNESLNNGLIKKPTETIILIINNNAIKPFQKQIENILNKTKDHNIALQILDAIIQNQAEKHFSTWVDSVKKDIQKIFDEKEISDLKQEIHLLISNNLYSTYSEKITSIIKSFPSILDTILDSMVIAKKIEQNEAFFWENFQKTESKYTIIADLIKTEQYGQFKKNKDIIAETIINPGLLKRLLDNSLLIIIFSDSLAKKIIELPNEKSLIIIKAIIQANTIEKVNTKCRAAINKKMLDLTDKEKEDILVDIINAGLQKEVLNITKTIALSLSYDSIFNVLWDIVKTKQIEKFEKLFPNLINTALAQTKNAMALFYFISAAIKNNGFTTLYKIAKDGLIHTINQLDDEQRKELLEQYKQTAQKYEKENAFDEIIKIMEKK